MAQQPSLTPLHANLCVPSPHLLRQVVWIVTGIAGFAILAFPEALNIASWIG